MLDLHGRLTAFVITVGEPSLPDCLVALRGQDCEFDIKMIENIAPMEAAFQHMLDDCETPFFIQVDADMILYPSAVRTLWKAINAEDERTMMVCYPLHDKHLDRAILGVKIYRHAIIKRFPYERSFSCETSQIERAKKLGYKVKIFFKEMEDLSLCLGTHGTHYTPKSIFERYRNLFQRFRLYPFVGWLGKWPQTFLERYKKDPSELNLYALLGTIVGLTCDLSGCTGDKDFRRYDKMEDYKTLRATFLARTGPIDLNLYVTSRCNLRCWFCRRQLTRLEESPEMTPDVVDLIIRKYSAVEGVCLAGFGEPFLNQDLPAMVRVLNEHEIVPSIITNGSLLEDRIHEFDGLRLAFISVSLNESNAKDYEITHGVKIFDKVLHGIEKTKGHHKLALSKVVTTQNYTDIPAFLELARSLGVDFVNLVNLLPHQEVGADDTEFWKHVITREDNAILNTLQGYRELDIAKLVQTWPIPISNDASKCPFVCRSPWASIGIDGRTFYSPCRRIWAPSEGYGSIDNPDVWLSPAYKGMRENALGTGKYSDLCAKCFASWEDY